MHRIHAISRRTLKCCFLILTSLLQSQSAPAQASGLPAYDVVSIVPNKADSGSSGWNTQEASFIATNVNLKMLVGLAYNIRQDLISGLPGWASAVPYDVNAKIVDPDLAALKKLTEKQRSAMLTQVLEDRFHLKVHTETKQLAVYNLVVTPHGPKFKPSAIQDDTKSGWFDNNNEFTGNIMPMSGLTDFLAGNLHRTIIDQTNLTARYDVHLKWASENQTGMAAADDGRTPAADAGPSLFSALIDQLGLKLVPAKGPVTTLVVDHVDLPTPN